MAFVREWPLRAVAGCWPRAARRAASACLPESRSCRAARPRRKRLRAEPSTTRYRPQVALHRLKTRADFLRVAADARRAVRPGLCCRPRRSPPARRRRGGAGRLHRKPAGRQCGAAQSGEAAVARGGSGGAGPATGANGTDYVLIARAGDRRAALCRAGRRSRGGVAPARPARRTQSRRGGEG